MDTFTKYEYKGDPYEKKKEKVGPPPLQVVAPAVSGPPPVRGCPPSRESSRWALRSAHARRPSPPLSSR